MSLHPHNTRTTTAATSELQTLTKLQTLNGGEEEESYEKKKKLNGKEEENRLPIRKPWISIEIALKSLHALKDPAICISSNIFGQKVHSFHP